MDQNLNFNANPLQRMSVFFKKVSFVGKSVLFNSAQRGTVLGLSTIGLTIVLNQSRAFCSTGNEQTKEVFKPTIYQYLICPFCNRVKSYLDFIGVEYDMVEVNPLTKSEINFPVKNKKVPIAIINGQVIEDSSKIIEFVTNYAQESKLATFPGKEFFPADTEQWNEWSEKKLAVMLYPNITRTFEESWECFEYASRVKSWNWAEQILVRVAGTAAMSLANGKIKKKYGIVDERKELKAVVAVWCDALQGQKFLHGDKPTMPDLLVFGVLKSIQGLRTFEELMVETPVLKTWYDNVNAAMPAKKQA